MDFTEQSRRTNTNIVRSTIMKLREQGFTWEQVTKELTPMLQSMSQQELVQQEVKVVLDPHWQPPMTAPREGSFLVLKRLLGTHCVLALAHITGPDDEVLTVAINGHVYGTYDNMVKEIIAWAPIPSYRIGDEPPPKNSVFV